MNLKKTLDKINQDRNKNECCFVFSLWKNPELYADYHNLNEGNDNTLKDEDAIFYFNLGRSLFDQGVRSFDSITIDAFLKDKSDTKKKFEEYGGMSTVEELKGLISSDNVDAYFDSIAKMNSLSLLASKYDEMFDDVDRFKSATNEDVYNAFDLLNSSVNLKTSNASVIEELKITDDFIKRCNEGEAVGISYAKGAPLLNYCTLGCPMGDIYMFAALSGTGKTSFIFENMIIPFRGQGLKCAIISNEMKIDSYRHLLLIHILTHDLKYYKLTRKKLKTGNFSAEERDYIEQAKIIADKDYDDIKFVKLFNNNIGDVIKYIKRLKVQGVQVIALDTFKSDDNDGGGDGKMWEQLLQNSRKLFNAVSKENIALITTFQLALHTTNQRYLDASCLSNSKQVKEVLSELVLMRKLWADEYTGEKYDCKAYKFKQDNKKVKEMIQLDPDKIYTVCFLDKTRNDEDKKTILFEWQGHYNKWKEIGFCTIVNDHRSN